MLGVVEKLKTNQVDFQGIHIEHDDLSRFFELGHRDQANGLPGRPFDDRGFESGLVADKVDVWTPLDDERVLVLERVAPCTCDRFVSQSVFVLALFFFKIAAVQDGRGALTQSIRSRGCTTSPSQ